MNDELVGIKFEKMPIIKEPRVIFSISLLFIAAILFGVAEYMDNEVEQWCAENWWPSDNKNVGTGDGAPFEGRCYESEYGATAGTVVGYSDAGTSLETAICCFPLLAIIPLVLIIYSGRRRRWSCGNCQQEFKSEQLKKSSEFIVKSTSMSTKKITSSNPQVGIGVLGGKAGSFVSMGGSTAHVPIAVGRVTATHRCPAKTCSIINQWQFDTEVQVWTDATTGEVSYEITGGIHLPH